MSSNKHLVTSNQTDTTKAYHKLQIWQEANKLVILTYQITNKFPKSETWSLVPQMRRSAISIAANIVEGHAKKSNKDFLRFLDTSNGSLAELEYYFELATQLGYINKEEYRSLEEQRLLMGKLLNGFMNSVRRKL